MAIVRDVHDNRPKKKAKKSHLIPKWTTAWHHGVGDALVNTHLQSFDSPIIVGEEWPSLEKTTRHTGD